jgi:hypothetical protein
MCGLGRLTACRAFIPFKNMVKGIYYCQVKISDLPIYLRVAVRPHEKLGFLDA